MYTRIGIIEMFLLCSSSYNVISTQLNYFKIRNFLRQSKIYQETKVPRAKRFSFEFANGSDSSNHFCTNSLSGLS